jgi:hypothetical protein
MKIFETEDDLKREMKAMKLFVSMFGGSFRKLDPLDIDYKVFDSEGQLIAYAEVKGRIRTIHNAYPLPISARKLVKLIDKRIQPVIIWACEDGIIYGKADKLVGEVKLSGRTPREGAANDIEMMVYYERQKNLKYIRYK